MARSAELECFVHGNRVEVLAHHQRYLTIGIHTDGRLFLSVNELKLDDIDLSEHTFSTDLADLDVYILTLEEEPGMALPRTRREPATTRRIPAQRRTPTHTSGSSADHIAETTRDSVLNAILDSLLDHPDQTPQERRDYTESIAIRYSEPLYAVAGVRANLTRGTYGDPDRLLYDRRLARKRAGTARTRGHA